MQARGGGIDNARFLEYLRETEAIELYLAELYLQYAQLEKDLEIKRKLEEFAVDADRLRVMAVDLITSTGGRPNRLREIATSTWAWGKGFMDIGRRGRFGTLQNLQDLLQAERKGQATWEILKAVGEAAGDQLILDVVNKALAVQQEHLDWLQPQVVKLARETMVAVQSVE